LEPALGGINLRTLDGSGRVDVLGADLSAFAYECALPNSIVAAQNLLALIVSLVARVHVVTIAQGYRCWT
jgi:hypothetical protein